MTRQHLKRNLKMETHLIVFVYLRLSWLVGAQSRLLLLTTTGRKSGRKRSVPALYMRDGGNYVVVTSNAGSDYSTLGVDVFKRARVLFPR